MLIWALLACSQTPLGPPASENSLVDRVANQPPIVRDIRWATIIVPGERVGVVSKRTSHADLLAAYPGAVDASIPLGEGFVAPGTTVHAEQPDAFTVIWATEERLSAKEVRDLGNAWHTVEGVSVGTSLADLRKLWGTFDVFGFGWDYGGAIGLDKAKLAPEYAGYEGALFVRLQPTIESGPHYDAVLGDRTFTPDNADLLALEPKVSWIGVNLTVEGAEAPLVVPDRRVGGVTVGTTRDELTSLYADLLDGQIQHDGSDHATTQIGAGSPTAMTVVWGDATRQWPVAIVGLGAGLLTVKGEHLDAIAIPPPH